MEGAASRTKIYFCTIICEVSSNMSSNESASPPVYGSEFAAGADLCSDEELMLQGKDGQSLADFKKHLSAELTAKYTEDQKLNSQLDEKAQVLKKSESQLANERKSNGWIANLTERLEKAEVGVLERKMNVLERFNRVVGRLLHCCLCC